MSDESYYPFLLYGQNRPFIEGNCDTIHHRLEFDETLAQNPHFDKRNVTLRFVGYSFAALISGIAFFSMDMLIADGILGLGDVLALVVLLAALVFIYSGFYKNLWLMTVVYGKNPADRLFLYIQRRGIVTVGEIQRIAADGSGAQISYSYHNKRNAVKNSLFITKAAGKSAGDSVVVVYTPDISTLL